MAPVDPAPFLFYVSEEIKKTPFKAIALRAVYSGNSVETAIERIIEHSHNQDSMAALVHCFYTNRDNSLSGHMAGNAKMLVKDLQLRFNANPHNQEAVGSENGY